MTRLSALDTLFMNMESPEVGMQGAFLLIYSGDIENFSGHSRYEKLVHKLKACLDDNPVFRRIYQPASLPLDYGRWIRADDVDLSHHVRQYVTDTPVKRSELARAYSEIIVWPMDLHKPMWELILIDNIDDDSDAAEPASFALVVKFHHAGVDGVSATEIVKALHTPESAKTHRSAPAKSQPDQPSISDNFRNLLGDQLKTGINVSKLLLDAGSKSLHNIGRRTLHEPGLPSAPKLAPKTSLNAPLNARRSYTWASLSIASIKQIRKRVPGSSVNDVYMAVCGGALRRYLLLGDELPEQSLLAGVPLNVRPSDADVGGNHFDVVRCPLGTHIEDPVERLQFIAEFMYNAKEQRLERGPGGASQVKALIDSLPKPWASLIGYTAGPGGATSRLPPLINLICTNVPGSPVPLALEGATLLDMNGAPPIMGGLGMVIAASSYCGELKASVLAGANILPDTEAFRSLLEEEFDSLYSLSAQA